MTERRGTANCCAYCGSEELRVDFYPWREGVYCQECKARRIQTWNMSIEAIWRREPDRVEEVAA